GSLFSDRQHRGDFAASFDQQNDARPPDPSGPSNTSEERLAFNGYAACRADLNPLAGELPCSDWLSSESDHSTGRVCALLYNSSRASGLLGPRVAGVC